MARFNSTANEILADVAAETMGVDTISDPWASTDPIFVRMRSLLNSVGRELVYAYEWEFLQRDATIVTAGGDDGNYPLPEDYIGMINQTQWDQSNRLPAQQLSPQGWTYLEGRDLVNGTLYTSWRVQNNEIRLYPNPPPANTTFTYEYMSKNWVIDSVSGDTFVDAVDNGADRPLFDPTLMKLLVKARYLEGLGRPWQDVQDRANQLFDALAGRTKGAEILNASVNRRGYPLLDAYYNVADTNYGNT